MRKPSTSPSPIRLAALVAMFFMANVTLLAQGSSIPTTSAVKEKRTEGDATASATLPEGQKYRYATFNGMSVSFNLFPPVMNLFGKDYGSYLLVQHKEVAGEKVDIHPELNDYYIEVETSGNDYRIPQLGTPIIFKDPTLAEMGATREKYIRGYLNEWGAAVVTDNFEKVYEMMDVDSFVNFFIVEELAKNIDGNFRKSTFMTKVDGQKLVLYHVWDFDIAFGNCNYMHSEFLPDSRGIYGNDPTGWYVKVVDERKKSSGLYQHLFKDPSFVARVKARWQEVYPSLCELPVWLEEEAAVNRESYDRNFQIWHILGTYVWPNPSPIPSDYDGELAFLKDFLSDRLEWMNSEISKW